MTCGSARLAFITLILLFFPGFPDPALAAVFNSPHDMYGQGYLMLPSEGAGSSPQCALCHPVHDRTRPRVWDMVPDSLERFGAAGNTCASCHDGVSIVDRNVDAALTVFHPASHGNDLDEAPEGTAIHNTGLPFENLRCIDCHDPHSQVNRPFLRLPITGLCSRCHKGFGYTGYGASNTSGNHPVEIEPFDDSQGPSPIELHEAFNVSFPAPYPARNGILSRKGHWTLGGHLTYGQFGKIECTTCHAFHGVEGTGPFDALLAKEPVNVTANEFCEGCHRGERGDDKEQPPFPNPGGTTTGRTYHPVDDDESNGLGWNVAIADTTERSFYLWGDIDSETDRPTILCTTCHVAHNGMENSPALVPIHEDTQKEGVDTFCEICHREPPEGHHGYEEGGFISSEVVAQMDSNLENLGVTFGEPSHDRIYCSYCHKAHNAGYGMEEENFIPILVDKNAALCDICHLTGVSHFLGDPTLPSTFGVTDPSLYRGTWPATGLESFYDGRGEVPTTVTCLSCHYLSTLPEGVDSVSTARLLAPADSDTEWTAGSPEEYLCTGCHGSDPVTYGEGHTHPLMEADTFKFPNIFSNHLSTDEVPATYTAGGRVNCQSCHQVHNAVVRGGVYILKVVRGENTDPKAIHPEIDFTELCHSCHPADKY